MADPNIAMSRTESPATQSFHTVWIVDGTVFRLSDGRPVDPAIVDGGTGARSDAIRSLSGS